MCFSLFSFSHYFFNLKNRILSSQALKTRRQILSMFTSNLEKEPWVWDLLGFYSILFFFLAVPEPLIQLFFVETSLDDEASEVFIIPVTVVEMIVFDKLFHLLLGLAFTRHWCSLMLISCNSKLRRLVARYDLMLNNIKMRLHLRRCFISGGSSFVQLYLNLLWLLFILNNFWFAKNFLRLIMVVSSADLEKAWWVILAQVPIQPLTWLNFVFWGQFFNYFGTFLLILPINSDLI